MMAKAVRRKAEERDCRADNDAAGAEYMSGLKPPSMLLPPPDISMNPMTIIAAQTAISMKFIFVNGRWLSSVFTISTFCRFCISRSRLVSGRRGCRSLLLALCVFFMSGTVWVWHLEMPWCQVVFHYLKSSS